MLFDFWLLVSGLPRARITSISNNADDEIIQWGRIWILPSSHHDTISAHVYYDVNFTDGHGTGQ
jgi:hypothetical protein